MLTTLDRLMARAQIALAFIFLLLVFAVILIYEFGGANKLTGDLLKGFNDWQHWLRDAGLVILYFFFQRQRGNGISDSTGTTTITQTVTAPDGSSHTVTSPAHLPLPAVGASPLIPTQPPQAAKS